MTIWYRYEDVQHSAGVDDWGDPLPYPGTVRVYLREFQQIRETPKGVWLDVYGEPRFVLNSSKKRFACRTKHDALVSFCARKHSQIQIYHARLRRAEAALLYIVREKVDISPVKSTALPHFECEDLR